jgi:hypothetical protein
MIMSWKWLTGEQASSKLRGALTVITQTFSTTSRSGRVRDLVTVSKPWIRSATQCLVRHSHRLGAEIIHRKQRVDGLVIWDMVCGTIGRPCPKLVANPKRATKLGSGRVVPPPCVYLFPRTLPDPRNNPGPKCWKLADIHILDALWRRFNGNERDVVEVKIEARMRGADLERRTRLSREGTEFMSSEWTTLRRARR